MLKNNFKYILILVIATLISCAKRGSITGGLKDTLAPELRVSLPKNFSTNFKGKEIKLTFDEYIKLKDVDKQLIISPPMKQKPIIYPTGVSKYITIKILDTLQPNTTYSFNFGQSVRDNNEGNTLNQFKYVFSTGDYVDSLSVEGAVKDAYDKEVESFVSIMLYEANERMNDSVVYNEIPKYITNTLDSAKTFKLENLKAGKYLLVAMKDVNSNTKFDSKKDKIAFHQQLISVPNDTTYELKLFQETPPFKATRAYQASGNRLVLPYEGNPKEVKITLKNGETILPTIITKFPEKDSLQIWFKPLKTDSIALTVNKEKYLKDFIIKIKDQKKDSLNLKALQSGTLNLGERFTIKSETPLQKFDVSKMTLINKDSVDVAFKTEYDELNQQLFVDFKKETLEKYSLKMMPGALTDYLENSNDTLSYRFSTLDLDAYGNLKVNLQNVKHFPILLELTNDSGKTLASHYSESATTIDFNLIEPGLFWLRLIYDENKNKEWDSGNYLEKRQAEEVIYFSKAVDVRANWDVDQVFDVSLPFTPEFTKKDNKKNPPKSRR